MKLKVKGLVFVGFAAAVFAQSALAADGDNKIVTSKKYVDEKIVGVSTTDSSTTINSESPDTKAPSALNVYKFVTGQVTGAAINVAGDSTYTTASYDTSTRTHTVSLNTGSLATTANLYALDTTNDGKLATAGAVKGLLDTTISGAETDTVVPTSKAVVDYAEKLANKATSIVTDTTDTANYNAASSDKYPTTAAVVGYAQDKSKMLTYSSTDTSSTIGANSSSNDTYPTTQNVYEFVTGQISGASGNYQQHVSSASGYNTASLYVGHNGSWNALEATVNSGTQATTDYVTIADNGSGVYQINLDSGQVASTISTASGTGSSVKLATEGAVYNYVSGNYQPKTTGTTIKVGYDSDWAALVGDSAYINVAMDGSNPANAKVSLTNIATTGTTINSATADTATDAGDLTTAYAVNQYVQSLLHGNVIPEPGSDCKLSTDNGTTGITDNNGVACALVLAYHDSAVGLKWIPMAQTAQ